MGRLTVWLSALCLVHAAGSEKALAAQIDTEFAPAWDRQPAFVWRVANPGGALSAELLSAFGGVNVEGERDAAWALEAGLDFYVGHGPGRDALHIDRERAWYTELWNEYWKTRDPAPLVREPCLSEDQTSDRLKARLKRSMAARSGRYGLGVSLGDEVSLTPWGGPLDLCESSACRRGFGDFLEASETWSFLRPQDGAPVAYPDTDRTRLSWIDGEALHVGAWLARREFHHRVLHATLEELAGHARQLSPGVPVGLFGQSGRTAFGDVGVEEVLRFLDFIEVYRILDARELLYTLRTPEQRSLLTLFRDEAAPHGASWIAWEHWMRGGDGYVIWSDRDLTQHEDYFRSCKDALAKIRALDQRLPNWRPEPAGVALIHSPNSMALSWLRDALNDGPTWMRRYASYQNEHGKREVGLRACLRLAEDCGFMPGALPIDQVDASAVKRFPVLIANHLMLVSEPQHRGLVAYLKAGGRLVVTGDFASYDLQGERSEPAGVEGFSLPLRQRIERVEFDAKRYLDERWSARGPRDYPNRARRLFLATCAPRATPNQKGFELSFRTLTPWLAVSQFDGEEGAWLHARIPNAEAAAERAQLSRVEFELRPNPGWTLEVLHPLQSMDPEDPGKGSLPPGEALVFRVRRVD